VRPPGVCTSNPWSISSACKNLRGQHPLPRKIQFGWVDVCAYKFFCGPKFIFFSANVVGFVVDQLLFRFSTGRSVRDIFAIKIESCLKSRRILPSQILGGGPSPKVVPTSTLEHPCLAARRVEKFRDGGLHSAT